MKVPISWLREFVDFDDSAERLAERLTMSGTEVEGIEKVGCSCSGVVVGEVLSVAKHPRSDKLSICRVGAGDREYRVVCGASNFKAGDKAAFAPAGAVLVGGLLIKETSIRGEFSEGMLCAEDELGISDDHSGIMILPASAAPGSALQDIVGEPETVLNIEVTWNRPDCLSIIGIAREVAALCGGSLKMPELGAGLGPRKIKEFVNVEVADSAGCTRYTACALEGVVVGPSPDWMQRRLHLCGMRPINSVVDITNYVLLETGHPLHAFDRDLLRGDRIVVRRAVAGEEIRTLDGETRKLHTGVLVIADEEGPVALAGIMGGEGSEIRDATTRVVLESACFDPGLIHSASADLGVASESSRRFERGVDVTAVEWAGRLAAGLMVEHASASASPGSTDVWPVKPQPRRIRCRYGRGRDLLGMRISDGEMADIFVRLGMNVDEKDAGGCTVTAPAFRPDIEVEADLFEEVARVHGLGEVASVPPRSALVPESDDVEERAVAECRKTVMALGFSEIVNYSFVSAALLDLFGKGNAGGRLVLPNPVSSDYAVMRDSLVPQMVETIGRNAAHQVPDVLFFEMGRVFGVSDGASIEEGRLCMGLSGKAGRVEGSIRAPATGEEVFLRIKGAAEALGAALKTGRFSFRSEDREWAEPGWCVMVELAGAPVGVIGLVKSALRREWRFAEPVGICEMSIAPLITNCFSSPVLSDIPAYPSISRDVAMIVDDSVTHEQVVSAIRAAGPPELTEVLLFDTFRSESMGPGKRSLAYTLEYRSGVRTLTDEEANAFHDRVKEALRGGLKAEIRES